MGDFVEQLVGEREEVAIGVEEDEVVGDVGGLGDEGLDVEGVQGGAGGEVAAGDAGF